MKNQKGIMWGIAVVVIVVLAVAWPKISGIFPSERSKLA